MAMTIAERDPSSRALVPGLETVQPIASTLPSLLQEDDFCVRLTTAFDDVLAPVLVTLDCFGSYLDPQIAPQDFVDWLAGWVGVETDETWPVDRRRDLVAEAIEVYRRRGTQAGLVRHVELYAGVAPSIEESGGCTWSQEAGGVLPGSPQPRLVVRLELDGPSHVDAAVVDRITRFSRPAHVPHEVFLTVKSELVETETLAPSSREDEEASADAPPPVHPPDASVVEVGPGVPADPDDPEAPEAVTTELIEDVEEREAEEAESDGADEVDGAGKTEASGSTFDSLGSGSAAAEGAEGGDGAGDETRSLGHEASSLEDEAVAAPEETDLTTGGGPGPIDAEGDAPEGLP